MTQTIYKEVNDMGQLKHYGVLGMKWGVRRDEQSRNISKGKKIVKSKQNLDVLPFEVYLGRRIVKNEKVRKALLVHFKVKTTVQVADKAVGTALTAAQLAELALGE